jgi:Ca-activated chloride channel homolog
MNFGAPVFLWFAALFGPLLACFYWWTWRRSRAAAQRFIPARLWAVLTEGVSTRRQIVKRALVTAGVVVALFAAARPRWGMGEEETASNGLDIIVCTDVSKSMIADDVAPNRLGRAKLALVDLARTAKSDRLGIVAFAGEAFLQCPLTFDTEAFVQTAGGLDFDTIPLQGTDLASAIREAGEAFNKESDGSKAIVIISDGEDHEEGAVEAAREAFAKGIHIYALGVGTDKGAVLRTADPYGNPVFVKDDAGNAVKSRLEPAALREVTSAAGGFYLPLDGRQSVEALYRDGPGRLPRQMKKEGRRRDWIERFQWPLGLAIALLSAEMLVPEARRRGRSAAVPANP